MTDSTFESKSSKKESKSSSPGFGGTLALRISIINLLFLVAPLLTYCLMMYRYDAALKEEEYSRSLNLMSDTQVVMIQKLTDFRFQTLELASIYLKDTTALKENQQKTNNDFLKKIGEFEGVNSIFVLKKNVEGQVVCEVSSEKCLSLPFYKAIFFDPSLQSSDYAIEAGGSFKKDEIFFTKVMKRDEKGEVLQTISIAISVHVFMNYLTQAQGYKGVYTIALFGDKDLIIFEGQDPSLIGKQLIIGSSNAKRPDALHSNAYDTDIVKNTLYLKELSKEVDTYGYSVNGKLVYATVLPVVHMNFGILISRAQFEYTPYLRNFFYNSLIFFVSIILFGSIGAWILTYLMATPLRHLCEVMAKVGNEDLKARYVQSLYGFEINRVGDLFNITLQKLLDHLQRLHSRVLKQEVLKQELYIGHEIQKSLVPTAVPEVPGIEIKTGLIPAKEVGGDFYDLFINRTDELLIVMADTAGHGVSGCFYSLMMRSILRTLSSTVTELKDVIIKANEIFYKDSAETLIFVTTWVGSYNQKTKLLQYSSCGHPLGFIFRNQKLHQELVTPGIALGVIEEVSPVIESISLQQGDILVFITDGLIETRNSQGEMFGKTRFIQVVEKHFSMDITSLFENIIQELEIFEEDPDNQEDDVTMVVIRIK